MAVGRAKGWRGTADLWLDAAHEALVRGGVEAVKVLPLAQGLGLSRTSFYHHFDDREALLAALVSRWRARNGPALVGRAGAAASTVTEAILGVFDCWVDAALFDSRLEFAIRNWALTDTAVAQALKAEDALRLAALAGLFRRHGADGDEAEVRARTVYLTQIGYIAMGEDEDFETRMARVPTYALTFTGKMPSASEIAAFRARHDPRG
ncbi:TetR/AcrR family transcriptional regulator [Pseudogemmobacter sonorensis]|uniref:TetR/AcrR family transcriptional regulator n=1 Tax=Pseudogemmobacter sonorensis TaxID=2989681 RepID=UPI0036CD13B7